MPRSARPTVLVVDDEVEVTYALQAFFQQKGYEMVTAFDGGQAMAALQATPVDLVLLDLKMPGVNGIEVLRFLRHHRPATRVIVITAYDDEYRALVEPMGVHGFLNKPFGIEGLTRTIEQVLQQPAEQVLAPRARPALATPAGATPKAKLLLIEPSEYLFNVKRVFFESPARSGGSYRVEGAFSSVEALEKLHAFRPDLVLVDLMAAGSLGDLAAQLLRSSERPKELVVHGSGTVAQRQQEKVEALTQKGVQLVLNETFTQAGLERLNTVVRDVALQHGLTAEAVG